jgi:hypothetical protein
MCNPGLRHSLILRGVETLPHRQRTRLEFIQFDGIVAVVVAIGCWIACVVEGNGEGAGWKLMADHSTARAEEWVLCGELS